jgi:hypothetical protein
MGFRAATCGQGYECVGELSRERTHAIDWGEWKVFASLDGEYATYQTDEPAKVAARCLLCICTSEGSAISPRFSKESQKENGGGRVEPPTGHWALTLRRSWERE